jgi:hypothetical protein
MQSNHNQKKGDNVLKNNRNEGKRNNLELEEVQQPPAHHASSSQTSELLV